VESIGEKLRTAREAKKITVKDVSAETNISTLYIEALEEEDFERFPSETYLIGFLRSYADFLKLDSDEIVQSYKGHKIGESVTPLEELTKPTRPSIMMMLSPLTDRYRNIFFAAGIAVVVLLLFLGINAMFTDDVDITGGDSVENIKKEYTASSTGTQIDNVRNLQLHNNRGYILVYKNEAVQFLVDKKEIVFLLKEITADSVDIELLPENRVVSFKIEKPELVSLEGSPRDMTFTLKGLTENRAKIMVELGEEKEPAPEKEIAEETGIKVEDSTSVVAQNRKNLKIVLEADFTQKSFIEIYLDGAQKMRGFIPAGRSERWEAAEYIQIKIGNAGGFRARINGRNYSFGKSGQVANKVITWKKDVKNPNLYHIVVKDW